MRRALAAVAVALLAGCGGGDDGERIRLVIPDNNIRDEGVECSGARPFQQLHRGTPFRIEDAEGEVVADGALPSGLAENADPRIDWESKRMPTVCVMELEVELPEHASYRLVLPETAPLEFARERLEDEPVELVVRG